jgi:N-methylhydantoinase B
MLAADRLAGLGQWCQPRHGIELVEVADPVVGELISVDISVRGGIGVVLLARGRRQA